MADSPAERARRSRRHLRDDHSLCKDPERCTAVTEVMARRADDQEIESGPARSAKARLLWDEMSKLDLGPIEKVLLDEACACMDRLVLLRSRETEVAMTEARHQATALKGLLAEIRKGAGAAPKPPSKAPPRSESTTEPQGVEPSDDFSSRLAARRAAAAS